MSAPLSAYPVPPLSAYEPPYAFEEPPLLPPVDPSRVPVYTNDPPRTKPLTPSPTPSPRVSDWFSESRHWSSHLLAEKTCEMICYLWFSKSSNPSPAINHSPPLSYFPHRNSKTAWLQFNVSSVFVHFMQKLLQTTQLSQSVIVLSLHYVYRLKERNSGTIPHPGSEFRVAVAALMMANKFVDDNTYTNKTWSEVSGIELSEINKMEREFLEGIDFGLYVDKATYDSWVNLLKGLVMAKERDGRHFRRSRQTPRTATVARPVPPLTVPSDRTERSWSSRARSSSPVRYSRTNGTSFTFHPPQPTHSPDVFMDADSTLRSRAKRSAVDAFSPTSATFDLERPAKKPTGLALEIPEAIGGMHTPSPLESLQFSQLSLGSSPAPQRSSDGHSMQVLSSRRVSPQTLVAAYRVDPTKPRAAPQHLYFYSLAGSPLAGDSRTHKGRLRYHQPPAPSMPASYAYAPQAAPFVVQSASASPHESHTHMTALPPVLPPPSHSAWAPAPPAQYDAYYSQPYAQEPVQEGAVPSAPFANAGPPGVHYYYPTPAPQRSSPDAYWRRGRRI
ncbi:hypothetical protein FA95DRAFT_1521155 [Auriscalpium vulgare]|uniref:Uncharacterized protein n=1 Tax=Auriscalpium vulgare TaxID=40419 RepID=A0ACB8RNJ8_9AGAM|nr:hypothetical protein FA95DRAFT_1521155 [Auriscalpium vulgare]